LWPLPEGPCTTAFEFKETWVKHRKQHTDSLARNPAKLGALQLV
jgi:hypothetical protein